jgi:ATP-binding cassette subfamily C protein CydC
MKAFYRLFQLILRFRWWALLSISLGWATVASWIALIGTSSYLISYAALHPSVAELQVAIVGVRFFGITRGVFRYLERLVSHTTTFKILSEMRVWLFEELEKLTPAALKEYKGGDLLARVIDDIETLQDFFIRVVYPPIVALLSAIGVLWFFGRWSVSFSLVLFWFQFLLGVLLPILILRVSRGPSVELVRNGSRLRELAVDAVQGNAEITAFGIEDDFKHKLFELGNERSKLQKKMHLINGFHGSLVSFGINACVVVLIVLAVPMVSSGILDGKLLAVVLLGSLASFEAILVLPSVYQNLEKSLESARRLFEIIDKEPEVESVGGDFLIESPISLNLVNLSFSYPRINIPVLEEISLDLPAGKQVGIVGASGEGKTTVINLLLRYWNYSSGKIMLNGKDIKQYDVEEVRRNMGVLAQRVYLFNSSIFENIRLGNPKASLSEVVEAANLAGAHEFIQKLPSGYEAIVGEKGSSLSGGERQRIGLARLLLKKASIYFLDEPTANLDLITGKKVMNSILESLCGKSLLLVTHKLAGLPRMDEIIILSEGRIIERGTHSELVRSGGVYSRMWETENNLLLGL